MRVVSWVIRGRYASCDTSDGLPRRRHHRNARCAAHLLVAASLAIAGATTTATARETVAVDPMWKAGTIVVRTSERRLYLVLGTGTALRYRVAVGKPNKQWFGRVIVDGKYRSPAWTPPADMRRPGRGAIIIPGGAPNNPMGAAALTLSGDRYAIHGTNRPSAIGTFASAGCVRMLNEDVLDLFDRVSVGTPVLVQR
jgi:lipoprotein-anchoring transpeptidase ErfK/SrfK